MPVVDIGITRDEHAKKAGNEPAPEADYVLEVVGTFKDPYLSEKGNWVIPIQCHIIDDPDYAGKAVFERFTIGTFRWEDFCNATGFSWEGTSFASEDLAGLTFYAHLIIESFVDKMGKERLTNRIDSLWGM
jgi:hypothetical protein